MRRWFIISLALLGAFFSAQAVEVKADLELLKMALTNLEQKVDEEIGKLPPPPIEGYILEFKVDVPAELGTLLGSMQAAVKKESQPGDDIQYGPKGFGRYLLFSITVLHDEDAVTAAKKFVKEHLAQAEKLYLYTDSPILNIEEKALDISIYVSDEDGNPLEQSFVRDAAAEKLADYSLEFSGWPLFLNVAHAIPDRLRSALVQIATDYAPDALAGKHMIPIELASIKVDVYDEKTNTPIPDMSETIWQSKTPPPPADKKNSITVKSVFSDEFKQLIADIQADLKQLYDKAGYPNYENIGFATIEFPEGKAKEVEDALREFFKDEDELFNVVQPLEVKEGDGKMSVVMPITISDEDNKLLDEDAFKAALSKLGFEVDAKFSVIRLVLASSMKVTKQVDLDDIIVKYAPRKLHDDGDYTFPEITIDLKAADGTVIDRDKEIWKEAPLPPTPSEEYYHAAAKASLDKDAFNAVLERIKKLDPSIQSSAGVVPVFSLLKISEDDCQTDKKCKKTADAVRSLFEDDKQVYIKLQGVQYEPSLKAVMLLYSYLDEDKDKIDEKHLVESLQDDLDGVQVQWLAYPILENVDKAAVQKLLDELTPAKLNDVISIESMQLDVLDKDNKVVENDITIWKGTPLPPSPADKYYSAGVKAEVADEDQAALENLWKRIGAKIKELGLEDKIAASDDDTLPMLHAQKITPDACKDTDECTAIKEAFEQAFKGIKELYAKLEGLVYDKNSKEVLLNISWIKGDKSEVEAGVNSSLQSAFKGVELQWMELPVLEKVEEAEVQALIDEFGADAMEPKEVALSELEIDIMDEEDTTVSEDFEIWEATKKPPVDEGDEKRVIYEAYVPKFATKLESMQKQVMAIDAENKNKWVQHDITDYHAIMVFKVDKDDVSAVNGKVKNFLEEEEGFFVKAISTHIGRDYRSGLEYDIYVETILADADRRSMTEAIAGADFVDLYNQYSVVKPFDMKRKVMLVEGIKFDEDSDGLEELNAITFKNFTMSQFYPTDNPLDTIYYSVVDVKTGRLDKEHVKLWEKEED